MVVDEELGLELIRDRSRGYGKDLGQDKCSTLT